MLSFYFRSLSFKTPLQQRKKFYISIEITEGAPRTTETVAYFPRTNFAIFSETIEFSVKNPQENTYFHLEIYEEEGDTSKTLKKNRLCRETMHLNKMNSKNTKEVTINTKYGPAFVDLTLDLSEEFNETILGEGQCKAMSQRREEALSLEKFKLLKLAPLTLEFVLSLTPLVFLKHDVINFITWKYPHKTFLYSLLLSFFLIFNQKILASGLMLFFIFNKKLVPIIIMIKPPKDNLKGTMNVYKRNSEMMKELMQFCIWLDELQNKLFNDPEKKLILQILMVIKKFAPFLSITILLLDPIPLILIGYWTLLLYFTDMGKKALTIGYKYASAYLDHFDFDIVLVPIEKIEEKLFGGDSMMKRLDSNASNQSDQQNDSPVNASSLRKINQKVINQKTFVVYENQRWRLGRGWCTKMYENDRPPWSDDLGKLALSKDSFKLPGPNWVWDTDWTFVWTHDSDGLGWEYAKKFSEFRKPGPHKTIVNVVRRRKWIRKCVEIEN